MAHPTAVILAVGLTRDVISPHTPRLKSLVAESDVRTLTPVLPAVTCSVQASMLTGSTIGAHGIVGNGWYDRDLAEVLFWKQSNHLVGGEKVWDVARRHDPTVTTANLFWWFNMYTSAEYSVTPRPQYRADGRKIPDCYSRPADLRDRLQADLGPFPLFHFWGPGSSIRSSAWIAEAAKLTIEWHNPTLSFVYLPHLDYAHQKFGPDATESTAAATELDGVIGPLLDFLFARGIRPIVLSEYGIEPVTTAIPINRILREAGFLAMRIEDDRELLDPGASAAFAVADHQVAHVYVRDPDQAPAIAAMLSGVPGIESCLDRAQMTAAGIAHARSGELLAIAAAGHWFSYGWWQDDARAPDFARTVDIHRKPGYDPLELFLDPRLPLPKLTIARKLLLRKLGFRTLLDVIPLDPSQVRGSHGRIDMPAGRRPILVTGRDRLEAPDVLPCHAVRDVILGHLFDEPRSGG
jgi:predicted AlkP superfamily pyrophosphatase or phosphodiesterase